MSINVNAAMDTIGAALGAVTGLRVFDFPPDSVSPPAAIVMFPATLAYDNTHQRGTDRATFEVWVVVGNVSDRSARDQLAGYMDGSGPASSSVKAALDAIGPNVRVASVDTTPVNVAGQVFLGATFTIDYVA